MDFVHEHRAAWAKKPALRDAYRELFDRIRGACTPEAPTVELGSGPGFFKEAHPDIVATDVFAHPHAELVADAEALPFADASIANLVMLDVFHHLPKPTRFLAEAARVLKPKGRLVMIEPWLSLSGYTFYRFLHHEDCDPSSPPFDPFTGLKDPMEGNAALPYVYFRSDGVFFGLGLPLRIVRREPFSGLPWLLTGGFSGPSLTPLLPVARVLEPYLCRFPRLFSTRCLIVLERST
ncbi:MAG: class I SAM-dependent methyltransferase [Deltaproteobacteria bacterium]|nr:class I SAM-dependent methyltransferase [Deltaproteobacteria bacterium]